MNRVSLVGRITRDPEARYSQQSGNAVLGFTLAVDRNQRDANGQRTADFINCVAFGQVADFITRYVKKGFMLAVSGRLQSRSYQGTDGQTRYVTEVLCDSVENLTPRDNAQSQDGQNFQRPQYQPNNNNQYQGYSNPSYQPQPEPQYRPQSLNNAHQPDSFDVSDAQDVADDDLPF